MQGRRDARRLITMRAPLVPTLLSLSLCAFSIADDHGQDTDADPEALTERLEFIAELPRTPPGIEISYAHVLSLSVQHRCSVLTRVRNGCFAGWST